MRKSSVQVSKLKIKCETHPDEEIVSVCMNPFCQLDKLLCNSCLSQQLHQCKNKLPIVKLYETSEKTYTQIQLENQNNLKKLSNSNMENEVKIAQERITQLKGMKERIIAKLDQVIQNQEKLVEDFIAKYSMKDQNEEEQEESKEPNDQKDENRGKTLSQQKQIKTPQEAQNIFQNCLRNYLEEYSQSQEKNYQKACLHICSIQYQNHMNMRIFKWNESGHLVSKNLDDIFELELHTQKSISEFNDITKLVYKYDQIQIEGYDSCSQSSIENTRNIQTNSNISVSTEILSECEILSLDISQDFKFLIAGCGKPKYQALVYDISADNLQKPKLLVSLIHSSPVNVVSIAPNSQFFCTGGETSAVRMYSTQQIIYKNKNNLILTMMDHQSSISAIQYSKESQLLLTASSDCTLLIYDCSVPINTKVIHKLKFDYPVISFDLSVRFVLAVITSNNMCTLYQNARTNPQIIYRMPFSGLIKDVKISLNERYLCVNDYEASCQIYDLSYQPPLLYDTLPIAKSHSIAFHSDNSNIVAVGKGNNNYNVYEISSNDNPTPSREIYTSSEHTDTVQALKFFSSFIISGGKDQQILFTKVF